MFTFGLLRSFAVSLFKRTVSMNRFKEPFHERSPGRLSFAPLRFRARFCHRRRTLTEATSHFYQLDETSSSFWPLGMRNNPMSNRIVHQLRDRVEAQFSADIDPV